MIGWREFLALTLLVALRLGAFAQSKLPPPKYRQRDDDIAELRKFVNPSCIWVELPDNKKYAQLVAFFPNGYVQVWETTMDMNCPPEQEWSNARCGCVDLGRSYTVAPGSNGLRPCNYLAKVQYEADVGNFTNDVGFVSDGPGDVKANLGALTLKDSSSENGYALRLANSPLGFQKFASNDLQVNWRGVLKVKPDSRSPMTLLSDDCTELKKSEKVSEDEQDKWKPSIVVALGSNLDITLRFTNSSTQLSCPIKTTGRGWNVITIESLNSAITVTLDGEKCATANPGNPLQRTECRLYLGGKPGDSSQTFNGALEYFRFVKNPEACEQ